MYYDLCVFSMNGRIIIVCKNGDMCFGNKWGLSIKDIQQVQLLYCKIKLIDDLLILKFIIYLLGGNIGCFILVVRDCDCDFFEYVD